MARCSPDGRAVGAPLFSHSGNVRVRQRVLQLLAVPLQIAALVRHLAQAGLGRLRVAHVALLQLLALALHVLPLPLLAVVTLQRRIVS